MGSMEQFEEAIEDFVYAVFVFVRAVLEFAFSPVCWFCFGCCDFDD